MVGSCWILEHLYLSSDTYPGIWLGAEQTGPITRGRGGFKTLSDQAVWSQPCPLISDWPAGCKSCTPWFGHVYDLLIKPDITYSYSLTNASSFVDAGGCPWSSQQEPGAPYLLGDHIVKKPEAQ